MMCHPVHVCTKIDGAREEEHLKDDHLSKWRH